MNIEIRKVPPKNADGKRASNRASDFARERRIYRAGLWWRDRARHYSPHRFGDRHVLQLFHQ